MSKQQPTTQQQNIIDAICSNVAVSAGAGSGKTQVLIARFIHILEAGFACGQPINVDQIVAITFTKKAAAEMRARLRQTINDIINELQQDNNMDDQRLEKIGFWREQLERLPRTHISTIHSLCSYLLKENPREANLDPQFTVAESYESERFIQKCLERYIRAALREQNEDMLALVNSYGLQSFLNQLDLLLPQLAVIKASGDLLQPYRAIIASVGEQKEEVCELLTELAVNRDNYNNPKTYKPYLEQLNVQLQEVLEGIRQDIADFSLMRSICAKMQARGAFKEIYGRIKYLAGVIENKNWEHLAMPLVEHWQNVLQGLHDYVQEQKLAADLLTFDDLENMAISLLENYPEVRRNYHERFQHIMVDEFQDTNNRQRRLIYLLCGNSSEELQGEKLFIVGDPKQSIYRFRGADVAVFKRVQEEIQQKQGQLLSMDKNFRSRENILQAVNEIFEPLMGIDAAQEVYFSPLAADLPRMEGGVKPELLVAEYDESNEASKNVNEARLVAAKILQLQSTGVKFKDIAILMRSTTRYDVLLPVLQEFKIPFVLNSGSGFFERQEVMDLLNLFTALNNKFRSLELVGALRSPYFALDDDTLTRLFLDGAKDSCLWDKLQSCDISCLSKEQQSLVLRARELLGKLRQEANSMGLMSLWQSVWEKLKVPGVLSQQEMGAAQLANAEKLRAMAQSFVDEEQGTLAAWVTFMQRLRAAGGDETMATVEAEDAVQIMTFHASKGLQFPVVLLPFMNSRLMSNRDSLLFLPPSKFHQEAPWGLGLKVLVDGQLYDTYLLQQLKAEDKRCEEEERKRLLYVAATRAEQQLVFFANAAKDKNYADRNFMHKNWFVQLSSVLKEDSAVIRGNTEDLEAYLQPWEAAELPSLDTTSPMLKPLAGYDAIGISCFSPSALQSYAHCPRAYFYSYGLKLPGLETDKATAFTGSLAATAIGLIAHSTLEYYNKDSYDVKELEHCFKLASKEHTSGSKTGTEFSWTMLEAYVQSDLLPPLSRCKKEQKLSFFEQGLQFEGFIDCLMPNGDGTWTVVDYKTGTPPQATAGKNEGYMYQLALYRLAAEKQFGLKIAKCELHYLQNLSKVELADEEEYQHYLAAALKQCQEIGAKAREEGAFPCTVGKQCDYCPYAYLCKRE